MQDWVGERLFTTQWMYNYNHNRPNMALGEIIQKQWQAMAALSDF